MSFTVNGIGAIIILVALGIDICYNIYKFINWIITQSKSLNDDPLFRANVDYVNKIRDYIKHEDAIIDIVSFTTQAIPLYEKDYPELVQDNLRMQRIKENLYTLSEIIMRDNTVCL